MAIDFPRSKYTAAEGASDNTPAWPSSPSSGDTRTNSAGHTFNWNVGKSLWILATDTSHSIANGPTYSWDGEKWIASSAIPFRYHGAKPAASAPSGLGASDTGDLYYDSTNDKMQVFNGTAWEDITALTLGVNAVATNSIQDNAVTYAKLQNVAANRMLGNNTGSTADAVELTKAQVLTFLNVADGAEVNVQSDWNASSGDAEILNKPTIPAAQVQADWNQSTNTAVDFIKNKPTIPAAYTNSSVDAHLNTSSANSNEVLGWTGTDYDWVAQTAGYGDSNVDSHLNKNSASSGEVLSWSGSDYDWVSVSSDKIQEGTAIVECVDSGTSDHITFDTEGNERMKIDSSGIITVAKAGHAAPTSGTANQALLNIIGDAGSQENEATLNLWCNKVPNDTADVGIINFLGEVDTGVPCAQIIGAADGQWNSGSDTSDHPGKLRFMTVADGSSVPAEAMRIDSSGKVGIGDDSTLDAVLVLKANTDQNTTPHIRLKDDTDSREAWITNNSGDLVLCNGGNDNVPHCYLKMFDGNRMDFATGNTTRATLDSSGRLLIGRTASLNVSGFENHIQVNGTNAEASSISAGRFSNDDGAPFFIFHKSRGTDVSTNTAVASGNILGRLAWYGADGTDYEEAAHIQCLVDGTPAEEATDMPGRLQFATTPNGEHNAIERMRIDNAGRVRIGLTSNSNPYQHFEVIFTDDFASFQGGGNAGDYGAGSRGIKIENESTSQNTSANIQFRTTAADWFLGSVRGSSSGLADFRLKFENQYDAFRITNSGKQTHKSGSHSGSDGSGCFSYNLGNDSTYTHGILNVKNAGNRGTKGHASGSPLIKAEYSNATGFIIDKDAQCGINTASPQGNLHVKSTSGTCRAKIGSGDSNAAALYVQNNTTGDGNDDGFKIELGGDENAYVWMYEDGDINFGTHNNHRMTLDDDGHLYPAANNTYDLGLTGQRWRNIYTNDLNLSNEGSANDVDGTWGNYTIQEGEEDLFLINRRNGKKYKFNLTEV